MRQSGSGRKRGKADCVCVAPHLLRGQEMMPVSSNSRHIAHPIRPPTIRLVAALTVCRRSNAKRIAPKTSDVMTRPTSPFSPKMSKTRASSNVVRRAGARMVHCKSANNAKGNISQSRMHAATHMALAKRDPDFARVSPAMAIAIVTAGPARPMAAAFRAESHGAGPCLNPDNPISGLGTLTAMPIRKWPIS